MHNFTHKIEFPYFEEGNPQAWLRKCERYFNYNNVMEPEVKLEMAILH